LLPKPGICAKPESANVSEDQNTFPVRVRESSDFDANEPVKNDFPIDLMPAMVTRALASAQERAQKIAPPIVLKAALQGSGMAPSSLAPLRVIVKPHFGPKCPLGNPRGRSAGWPALYLAGNGSVEV